MVLNGVADCLRTEALAGELDAAHAPTPTEAHQTRHDRTRPCWTGRNRAAEGHGMAEDKVAGTVSEDRTCTAYRWPGSTSGEAAVSTVVAAIHPAGRAPSTPQACCSSREMAQEVR